MNDHMDISKTIEAKSDQINAVDLVYPEVVTITDVRKGDADQPVWITTAEYPGKYFKPAKTVRRVLVKAWGPDASQYIGRSLEIYNDPTVKWAGEAIGGVRVSKMSHIDGPLEISLPVSRGKREKFTIQPLQQQPQTDWQALLQDAQGDRDKLLALHTRATSEKAPQDILDAIIAAGQQATQPEQREEGI